MKCRQCKDELDAWMDRELDPIRDQEVRSHLDSCRSCREELNSQMADRTWWNSLPKESAPSPILWQKILPRLQEEPTPWTRKWIRALQGAFLPDFSFSWGRSLTAAGLAGLLLLSFSLVYFYPNSGTSGNSSATLLMEDYVRWRTQEAAKLHRSSSEASSVGDLKASNPFLDSNSSLPQDNPFISG